MSSFRTAWSLMVVGLSLLSSCGTDDDGLKCKDGDFYLDGKQFTDCDQCSSDECGFSANVTQVCSYPNGVQQCRVTSGKVTATCGTESATVVISNGVPSCG